MSYLDLDYIENVEEYEDDEVEPTPKRRRTNNIEYVFVAKFDSLTLAKEHMQKTKIGWNFKIKYSTIDGIKYSYRCRKGCPKMCHIVCPNENQTASLFEGEGEHHHQLRKSGLDDETREEVAKLFQNGKHTINLIKIKTC